MFSLENKSKMNNLSLECKKLEKESIEEEQKSMKKKDQK